MAIRCEICESTDIVKQDGVFVCQFCGTKYSVEDIKGMVSETKNSGESVSTLNSINSDGILEMAKKEYAGGNMAAVKTYVDELLKNDPDNIDGLFLKAEIDCDFEDAFDIIYGIVTSVQIAEKDAMIDRANEVLAKVCDSSISIKNGSIFVNELIPKMKICGWDYSYLYTKFIWTTIKLMNEYDIEAENPYAAPYFTKDADVMIQENSPYLKDEDKKELQIALYNLCDRILKTHKGSHWRNHCAAEVETIKNKYYAVATEKERRVKAEQDAKIKAQETKKREKDAAKNARIEEYWAERTAEKIALEQEKNELENRKYNLQSEFSNWQTYKKLQDSKKELKRLEDRLKEKKRELENYNPFLTFIIPFLGIPKNMCKTEIKKIEKQIPKLEQDVENYEREVAIQTKKYTLEIDECDQRIKEIVDELTRER